MSRPFLWEKQNRPHSLTIQRHFVQSYIAISTSLTTSQRPSWDVWTWNQRGFWEKWCRFSSFHACCTSVSYDICMCVCHRRRHFNVIGSKDSCALSYFLFLAGHTYGAGWPRIVDDKYAVLSQINYKQHGVMRKICTGDEWKVWNDFMLMAVVIQKYFGCSKQRSALGDDEKAHN